MSILNVLHDFPFSRNHSPKTAYDYCIRFFFFGGGGAVLDENGVKAAAA